MGDSSLDPVIRQFISRYIRTVEQLEILCLMSGEPIRTWTAAELLRAIQSSEKSIAETLNYFGAQGLTASQGDGHRFAPSDAGLVGVTQDLCRAYRQRRVAVIEAIYQKPSDAVQDFADAFKFRKDK